MVECDGVLEWLERVAPSTAAEFSVWVDGIESGDSGPVLVSELDAQWERLLAAAGGAWSPSIELEMRRVFGALTESMDLADDGPDVGSEQIRVVFRTYLAAVDHHPSGGVWEADLLADEGENATLRFDAPTIVDPDRVVSALVDSLEMLYQRAVELDGRAWSLRARRTAQAVAAVCACHLADAEATLGHVNRFFELDAQCSRESGAAASARELLFVAIAGTRAHADARSSDGVQDVMRLVRQRVEHPGESMPAAFVGVWARALQSLNPEFAQLLTRRLLFDAVSESGERSDEAFAAAFLLLEASVHAGDEATMVDLASEWMPLALAAEHGPGVQMWLESLEFDDGEDAGNG